jgi:hypothetical protein
VFSRFTRGPLYESGAASVDWTVSIARWELPGVLFHAALERLDGTLRIEVQGRVRQLFLVHGRPRLVVSPDATDLLGARLRAKSLIDAPGLSRVLTLACERGEPLGEVCVSEGVLTREHLEFVLRDQLDAKLAVGHGDLARWFAAVEALPTLALETTELRTALRLEGTCDETTRAALKSALQGLIPWRKGPFELFGSEKTNTRPLEFTATPGTSRKFMPAGRLG